MDVEKFIMRIGKFQEEALFKALKVYIGREPTEEDISYCAFVRSNFNPDLYKTSYKGVYFGEIRQEFKPPQNFTYTFIAYPTSSGT